MKLLLFIFFPFLLFSQNNLEKAITLFNQQKFELAQPYFELELKQTPNNLKVLEYLGDINGNLKEWDKAIFYYTRLKTLRPSESNYHYKYGGALALKTKDGNKLLGLRNIPKIRKAFETAILLKPNSIESRMALIELYIQLPGFVGGSEPKANKYADEIMRLSPVDGYVAKGHIEEFFGRFDNAEKRYRMAFEIGKSKFTFQKLYDLYAVKIKDIEKAKKLKAQFEK